MSEQGAAGVFFVLGGRAVLPYSRLWLTRLARSITGIANITIIGPDDGIRQGEAVVYISLDNDANEAEVKRELARRMEVEKGLIGKYRFILHKPVL